MFIASFVVSLMFVVDCFYIIHNDLLEQKKPEEVQHAVCQIFTKDFEATANATITRQLKGVCTSGDLHLRFNELEEKIFQKLDAIEKIMRDTFNTSGTEINKSYLEKFYNGLKVGRSKISNSDRHDNQFADLLKHNDSVRYTNQGNIYTYYWKLNNLHTIMYKSDLYVTSSNFIVLGHNLKLQFYPNFPEINKYTIQLKPSSKGFIKKHKFIILCQSNGLANIESDLLIGFKIKFQLTTDAIEKCVNNGDDLIIGVEIHLDS